MRDIAIALARSFAHHLFVDMARRPLYVLFYAPHNAQYKIPQTLTWHGTIG